MTSHFESIGIPVSSRDEFAEIVGQALAAAAVRTVAQGVHEHVWTDESGARLVVQTRGRSIEYVLPCLAGTATAVPAQGVQLVDEETATLELLDSTATMICPVAVELEDRAVLAAAGGNLESGSVVLAALAEEITVHADEQAYYGSRQAADLRLAADGFIPAGLFALDGAAPEWTPSARALFAGTVIDARTMVNSVYGGRFHRLRVRTIASVELDVAVAVSAVPAPPAPGNIVLGTIFVTGRLGLQSMNRS